MRFAFVAKRRTRSLGARPRGDEEPGREVKTSIAAGDRTYGARRCGVICSPTGQMSWPAPN
ncbi:hypothetical protein IVB36_25145 [Bradyrhizobium sp. 35]|nr:hypothetical protein [Bradyrhizobium sp. 35]